ncbi:unnamed protein product, partial [Didymodactylos carnosus]
SFQASKSMSKGLITIFLKFGITHRPTLINGSDPNVLNDLQDQALEVVQLALPDVETKDYRHRVKLFLISQDHSSPNLKLITRHTDLIPECSVEVIIWSIAGPSVLPREHQLHDHNYTKPTYCAACS